MRVLKDLRDQTDFLRTYDLIERILTRHDGRRKLLGRLGPEAEDGINALLSQALAYERTDIPSLTGFLVWMQTDDLEIKRQMGSAGDMIRVMTVHGSKGLEAPIVILPDTGKRRTPPDPEIMMADGVPLWKVKADQMPERLLTARAAAQAAQRNERLRLLYVALTRAEKWLIVTGAGELPKDGDSWYQMVEAGLKQAGAVALNEDGSGLRLEHGDWDALPLEIPKRSAREKAQLPRQLTRPAAAYVAPPAALSPSDLGGAKALPGEAGQSEDIAKARGTAIHLLLEHLPDRPRESWADLAKALVPDPIDPQEVLREVTAVLDSPALAPIFSPDTLAEVAFSADLDDQRIHGVIDRLIVTDDTVLAIDFKSNVIVPDTPQNCPEGLLRQMGAYAHALARIYPGRTIETALLWTACAKLMRLPHDLVSSALMRRDSP
jgi:ATP-dependent helicase/nuclease subunit A